MPTEPRSQCSFCRVCGSDVCVASRASAKPTALTLRWWSEADGWPAVGAWAAESRHARSPTAECQTNVVLPVRSAIFPGGVTECSGRKMSVLTVIGRRSLFPPGRAKPRGILRCLARAKHRGLLLVLAGRSLAAILPCPGRHAEHRAILRVLVGRSLATVGVLLFGRARAVLTVSRLNSAGMQCNARGACVAISETEWRQRFRSRSQSSCAGGAVPALGA
jgi:hypothetical protein